MAFDRTEPPGEAVLAETPEAAFSLEWGGTYVSPEEVREFLLLNDRQRRVLARWADRLIPAQAPWPAASEVDAHMYADNCAARSPLLRSMLLRAVDSVDSAAERADGRSFADCDGEVCDELLREMESGPDSALFDLALELIFEGYYRDERVLEVAEERTGFRYMAPVEGVELDPFDESLLDAVKSRPPRIREVER